MNPALRKDEKIPQDGNEAELVKKLLSHPADRTLYIKLAELLEAAGDLEVANSLYKGVVPQTFCDKHGIALLPKRPIHRLKGGNRIGWFPPESVTLTPPENDDDNRNSVFHRNATSGTAEFIDVLNPAIFAFDGKNRLILDSDGVACMHHSSANGFLLKPQIDATTRHDRLRLRGKTLILAARNANNFYHWFFDLLPNLALLEYSGVAVSNIDNVVVSGSLAPYHRRTFEMLGIDENKLRYLNTDRVVLECDELLMGRLNNRMGTSQGTRTLLWLRSKFLQYAKRPSPGAPKVLIDRAERGFENPGRVEAALTAKGYRRVRLEELDLADQIGLFAHADSIVSPHGAGLTLLAFSQPGTVVHEYYGEHVQPCFWAISSHLGLRYHNYNGSKISDGAVTTNNKGLGARLRKCVPISDEWLEALP